MRLLASGKVRGLYEVDADHVLLVASDRISAYDVILPTPIPDKGRVLTALTAWWLSQLADLGPHHMVSVDDPRIPAELRGRAMLCLRLEMVPVECVARGYLAGSGSVDYMRTGAVCGVPLPLGLREGDRLPEPIFTPATKATEGHDENVSYDAVAAAVGADLAADLRRRTLALYARSAALALDRGIVIADTKFEFGLAPGGELVLGDEVLTPDSSRFWPVDDWRPGGSQPSYDKQYVRDWLTERGLAGTPAELPADVVEATRERYLEAYQRLTGERFT
jgi:phosphoribosylaminoimidazole-succinocarboxamide synthase